MIEVGKYQKLSVIAETLEGLHLDGEDFGELILPKDELPLNEEIGKMFEVFLYYNAKEEVVATTKKPFGEVGSVCCLKVVDVSPIGAFLDWGLPKDLFVPRKEQLLLMKEGESYLVFIYKDNIRSRLAASSKLKKFLNKTPATFSFNQKVDLFIGHKTELGYNVVVDNTHWGLLYEDEVFCDLKYGQKTEGYIKKVRDDDKIDISLQKQGYQKMDSLEERIIEQLRKNDGRLNITDKSAPDIIQKIFGVSKKKYKMALGSLYKAKRIEITNDIKLLES